ncbi:glycosyltransferase [Actinomyces sp.]|uniref:glycosyltransferase family 2 protein n=1 Tax=Actinomyces sp. TaxID=29317 RepID=UPI0026DD0B04|nr:glycosyltransferase [Actinomyces sp.]MDO4899389.1 glycosyltransferase [Actinomyces sp.]
MNDTTHGPGDAQDGPANIRHPVGHAQHVDSSLALDIFIPFWGDPDYLYDAVRSVLAQNDDRWRLTVVDDCYPRDVSGFFESLQDPRVRYLRNETNLGIIENFRACQHLAEAEYTVFMGCDDLLGRDYVSTILSVAEARPGVEIIQPGVEVIDENGFVHLPLSDRVKRVMRPHGTGLRTMRGQALATSLMHGDWLYWPSLAFRTEALQAVDFLDEYEIILDVGLLVDLIIRGARLVLTDEVCFRYRRHAQSLSSVSLVSGSRLADERRFFHMEAERFDEMGWSRAERAARAHITSRLHAATLLPAALLHKRSEVPGLLRHIAC